MSFVEKYDVFLLDCDGVIWTGKDAVPGAADVITKLMALNKRVMFVTNNSTKTRQILVDQIQSVLGISGISGDVCYSSGIATARFLKDKLQEGEKVFIIGSEGFSQVMTENGIEYIGLGLDIEPINFKEFGNFKPDPSIKYVVGGFDPYFNHTKMTKAFIYIREGGAKYIATNLDIVYPLSKDRLLPGTGSVLAGLNHALGTLPTVIGKPSSVFFDVISKDHGITDKSRVLMVGDNLLTDIQFGCNSGIDTALVMTGVTTKEMLSEPGAKPTYIMDSMVGLLD